MAMRINPACDGLKEKTGILLTRSFCIQTKPD